LLVAGFQDDDDDSSQSLAVTGEPAGNQGQGSSTAYLLFYRRRASLPNAAAALRALSEHGFQGGVPGSLAAQVAREDEELRVRAERWAAASKALREAVEQRYAIRILDHTN